MLRASILRARPAARPLACHARPQWHVARRFYADDKKSLGETTVPNPAPTTEPSLSPSSPANDTNIIPPSDVPKPPPAPDSSIAAAGASRDAPTTAPKTTPPTGPGTASVAPDPVQPKPKKKKRRFLRGFLLRLAILSGLGYAGGVYYSLVSDNFHDFFTEYIPYGEDAVAYFEEREFRKRFPGRAGDPRLHPQISGENKVTIPGNSGLTARPVKENSSDLAGTGPHLSAVADNNKVDKVESSGQQPKANLEKESEDKVKAAHAEFEQAAKELVQRLDHQMQTQEAQFKEEFENERERLSQGYKERLQSELQVAQKVYEQKLKNQLLEQSISMQKAFTATVKERVEAEREGRLGKLNELSSSVHELEKLTAEWNSVIDANLKTQHLVVAVEAVRSALESQIVPKPFVTELAALKEIAEDDPVVSAAIASINPAAYQRGIPSSALLIDRFRRVAAEVRKAALLPEDAGVASHLASLAMSKVLFKKSGLAVGGDVEATLARTEVLLEEGDLDAAAREMNSLQGWAKVLSKDWLAECRRVLEVKQALDVIATEARLNSLLID
ncbi:hypothetical protein GGP41_010706 [Bipolaris sorokiniana]|uniref:MICOS complex subunit MIC60 n=1 Tax=Cochliobolus sativus TaxID=45130 RepID=A0A8H5ZKS0_COCSA|nr:hypothetical protein GGP41_010706 [Bipolaris sorokiniana]